MNFVAITHHSWREARPRLKNGSWGKLRGFTLIELMIVVVIIAILSAIALPSYRDSIRKSRRTLAKTALLDLASREEKFYSLNNAYASAATLNFTTAIKDGSNTYYNVTVTLVTTTNPPTYTGTATPAGSQAVDSCGTYTVNSLGQQTPTTTGCW